MLRKKKFISEFEEGQEIHDLFLVVRKQLSETKAGKPYLALRLMDRSGAIEGRVWDNAEKLNTFAHQGGFVRVQGTARSFRDQLQLGIQTLEAVDEQQVHLADFMVASKRSVAEMETELDQVISAVQDLPLRKLLRKIFSGSTRARFLQAPAAKKMHHACLGGLAEHTLSVCGLAALTCDHYPALDRDLLIAGALVHDIAKIDEFSFDRPPIEYTDRGRLLGHLVLGAEMVRRAADHVPELSPECLDQLVHLVLSHHGRHDFGAPVLPMTPEALILHHLDDMDAKMSFIDSLREKIKEPGFHWSEYQKVLERFLYLRRPDGETMGVTREKPSGKESRIRADPSDTAQKRQPSLF